MRKRLFALSAVLAFGIAPIFTATTAYADSMEELTVAHRGATTSKLGESTLPAYQYAVKNHADILDADVRWTKDGPDPDKLGTMVILHDATLDRITNCTGPVSSWLWPAADTSGRPAHVRQLSWEVVRLGDQGFLDH
jgi:glycerophosphoryl diester phosphodiesterase